MLFTKFNPNTMYAKHLENHHYLNFILHASKDAKENTIITSFIESNIAGFMAEEICNLCELSNCKNDFHLCGLNNEEICIREFVEKTYKTLIYRYGLFSKKLKISVR